MPQIFIKDPEAVLDYEVDWSTWLGADTISTSTWVVPAGLTEDSSSNTTTTATIVVSGGSVGSYTATNRITTAAGLTDDRTITIQVRER